MVDGRALMAPHSGAALLKAKATDYQHISPAAFKWSKVKN